MDLRWPLRSDHTSITVLEGFPLSPNGKIDRAALLRTIGIEGANGKLVAGVFDASSEDGVALTFRNGRIIKVEARGATGAAFEKWYRKASAENPKLLYLNREDLMRHEAAGITTDLFPKTMRIAGVE